MTIQSFKLELLLVAIACHGTVCFSPNTYIRNIGQSVQSYDVPEISIMYTGTGIPAGYRKKSYDVSSLAAVGDKNDRSEEDPSSKKAQPKWFGSFTKMVDDMITTVSGKNTDLMDEVKLSISESQKEEVVQEDIMTGANFDDAELPSESIDLNSDALENNLILDQGITETSVVEASEVFEAQEPTDSFDMDIDMDMNMDKNEEELSPAVKAYRERTEKYNRRLLEMNQAKELASPIDWRNKMKTSAESTDQSEVVSDPVESFRAREEKYNKKIIEFTKKTPKESPIDWRNKMKASSSIESTEVANSENDIQETISAADAVRLREEKYIKKIVDLTKSTPKASPIDWRNKMKTTQASGDSLVDSQATSSTGDADAIRLREEKYHKKILQLNKTKPTVTPIDWRSKMKANASTETAGDSEVDLVEAYRLREENYNRRLLSMNKAKEVVSPIDWKSKMTTGVSSEPVGKQVSDPGVETSRWREENRLKIFDTKSSISPIDWRSKMKTRKPIEQGERQELQPALEEGNAVKDRYSFMKMTPEVKAYRERAAKYNRSLLDLNKKVTKTSPSEWRGKMKTDRKP